MAFEGQGRGGAACTEDPRAEPRLCAVVDRLVVETHADAVLLFGSRGRGDHRPDSDYDLYVLVPETRRFVGRPPFWLWTLVSGYGLPVDVFMMSTAVFERRRKEINSLEEAAFREGVVVFERNSK